jgi:hypothetical protein
MTLVCVLLKDRSLVLVVGLGPEICFRACLWVTIRPSFRVPSKGALPPSFPHRAPIQRDASFA